MTIFIHGCGILALVYFGVCMLGYFVQGRILFAATKSLDRTPADFNWPYEDVLLPVDSETTHGWFVPLDHARGVVLFSHGNAGNIAGRLESIGLLRSFGFSVLAYDYGGYGRSTGSPSEERCYRDVRAMWRYLTETRGIPAEHILLFGRSLGGGVTADLATEVRPAAVILESTFLSVPEAASDRFPWLPTQWIITYRFANKEKVGRIQSPLMIVHSPDDTLVRFRHGKRLFELAHEPKTFLQISGDHNMGFVESMEVYRAGWEDFLRPILPN